MGTISTQHELAVRAVSKISTK